MNAVYRYFATYQGLVYILLAMGGLFAFRWLVNSWREWQDSIYGLEREFSMRRLSRSLSILLLIVFLFFGEIFLVSYVVPSLPASDIVFTPTLDMLSQTDSALAVNPEAASTAAAPSSGSPSASASGCVPGELALTSPEPGQEVKGIVTLIGTVDIENFGFYKYEVSPLGAEAWATISAGKETVRNGEVGLWDTSALVPGDYQVRLEVVDNEGKILPPCTISVRVIAQ